MLDVLRRSQRWVMGAVVFLVGGVFVAYLGIGGFSAAPAGDALVQLGGRRYTLVDVQRERDEQERRLREGLGEAFDPQAAGAYLDQIAAERLIGRAVAAEEAQRIGLRATDDEVRQVARALFRTSNGALDAEVARGYAERRFGSERRFVEELRDDILNAKLIQLIDAGVAVADAEVRDAIRYRKEELRLALVILDPEKIPTDLAVEDAEVERMLADQGPRVRQLYDQHPERYHLPERVRARHVLLRVAPDVPAEQVAPVRERAEAALARIRGGEDFAAVASQVSEDPGSKDRGGDLGLFPRGQMAPAFEQAAFSLEPGQSSDLVRTEFGFHLIRVEERAPAQDRNFDEVAREIAVELGKTDRARALAEERSTRLVEAVRGGRSLVDAAREADVTIERPDWISRRPDGFVPGVGPAPELLQAAFALTAEKPTADRVFEVAGKRVLVERLERRGPTAEDLAELSDEREQLLDLRRAQAREAWIEAARDRLLEEGRLRVDLTPIARPARTDAG